MTIFNILSLSAVYAQSEDNDVKVVKDVEKETIIIIGTRISGRSVTDSLGPVDIISAVDVLDQAGSDMTDLISKIVPSYNVRATGDAASLVGR
ncbi:hypothetical protein CXF85_06155 [Colwellia sp. 75C3]|uniref:hypothetical protein n=1 Tax=Colwellia sp. 75C3 TaxID=888425 RepID=UPI000CA75425|nr:hypothetical protein [Colwellia sp. 75C3]PKG85181.1 hypothetical protein CXF85_06155 [Colwellia sp. 75C3]